MNQLQRLMHIDKYARWLPEEGRRETWNETCERVTAFFRDHVQTYYPHAFSKIPWDVLHDDMVEMRAMPSMRVMQMAGPALKRDNLVAYNCAALPLQDFQAFGELLYILMGGTGCGFSVETRFVDKLPRIKKQKKPTTINYVIGDSTEGWCDALVAGMEIWANGEEVSFDYSQCRPAGTPLKTKGGRSSGPEPLKQLLDMVKQKVLSRQGSRLSPLDCHDIACMCGNIVQVGGVRRAAEISLSDLDDHELRDCKQGAFWNTAVYRSMSNNSAVYEEKPSCAEFMEEWTALMKSGTGERGIFNRGKVNSQIPKRRKKRDDWLVNPCGEIYLRPFGLCNLSIAVARAGDTEPALHHKLTSATIWGTLQSTLTNFNYVREQWKLNAEEERLLGVDITGQWDCAEMSTFGVEQFKQTVLAVNREYADILGIAHSAATTCVKPSGNSSQFLNTSSGIHPRFAPYYIRRLRIGAQTPVGRWLRESGIKWSPEVGQSADTMSVMVVDFPVATPEGCRTSKDVSALEMLNYWLYWKLCYTEHNPSVTIYVADDEWLEVGAWVWRNWDHIGGLSFLPKSDAVYQLAPYEEITKSQYEQLISAMPQLDFSKLQEYEQEDSTDLNREYACVGGSCEL